MDDDAISGHGGWSRRLPGASEAMLCAFAERLGAGLRAGDVLLLFGEMGAGKTTFTRALARGLGVTRPDRVCSPTFNLRIEHAGITPLVHVDLCRLVALGPEDGTAPLPVAAFEALGLDEWPSATDEHAVLVVEWADAWREPPPLHLSITLRISIGDSDRRDVVITGRGRITDAAEAALQAV